MNRIPSIPLYSPKWAGLLTLILTVNVNAQWTTQGGPVNAPMVATTTKSFTLHLINGKVDSRESLIRVTQGDLVDIKVQSDLPGELHLHAYRLKLPISDNNAQQLSFKANASGKFQIEWHPKHNQTSDSQHQAQSLHHGPALASLEVLPP
jgi:hypothetical protein